MPFFHRKISILAALGLASALSLVGCISDDSDGASATSTDGNLASNSPTSYSVAVNQPVLSINEAEGLIITSDTSRWCSDGSLEEEVYIDTTLYSVTNGKLQIWDDNDCSAIVLSGSGSDVFGTWTLTGSVELTNTTEDCDESSADEDVSMVYTISQSVITGTYTVTNFCLMDQMLDDYYGDPEIYLDGVGSYPATKTDCNTANLLDSSGNSIGTVEYTKYQRDGQRTYAVTLNGTTCTYSRPAYVDPQTEADCAADEVRDSTLSANMTAFRACLGMDTTGYYY